MNLKLLMKALYQLETPLQWDDEIPAGNHDGWVGALTEALLEGVLHFPKVKAHWLLALVMGVFLALVEMSTSSGRLNVSMGQVVRVMEITRPISACPSVESVH